MSTRDIKPKSKISKYFVSFCWNYIFYPELAEKGQMLMSAEAEKCHLGFYYHLFIKFMAVVNRSISLLSGLSLCSSFGCRPTHIDPSSQLCINYKRIQLCSGFLWIWCLFLVSLVLQTNQMLHFLKWSLKTVFDLMAF